MKGVILSMKSKIIKKMLAAILVALTVISTPGLVSAGPKRRRQGGDGKKQKTFLGKKTKRSQEDEKESKKGYEKEFVEKFEKDFDKWFGYDPAEDDCDLDFFDIGFGEELSKEIAASEDIFELLVNKYDEKRSELLEKIEKDLKVSSSNSQCSKNEKSDKKSLGIESLFNKDPNTFKQQCKIVAAVVELANSEFFQKFPTKQVVDIAKKFEANLDNQRVIEKLLEKYKKQQLSKIVDILLDRLSDDEEKIAIVEVIAGLSGHKFSHMYEQQQITRMVDLLIGCGDVKGIKKHIKLVLCRLAYWDVLKNCPEKQIFELTDKLVEWLKDDDERDCVADCIRCLAEENLLNNHTQQQIMVILDSLIECANASEKKEYATWAIYHLADRHLLKKCSEEQIARLVDELFKWIEDDNCIYCVADIASCLSDDSLLDSQTKQQIVEMVIKRLESDVAKLMEIMQQFARHGLLKDCSKDRIKKLMDVLLEAAASENGIKYNFGPVFEEFFAADFLKEYSEEQITHIIDVWFKWMDAGVMSVLNKDDSNKDNSNKDD